MSARLLLTGARATVALLAGSGALAACAGEGAEATMPGAPPGTPLRIASAPQLSVGVLEGDASQQFERVVTPFLLADGRLVVPDAGAGLIRVFDGAGALVASHGGSGKGPGEFSFLQAAWARADTIEAFDGDLLRITRFAPGGAVETVALTGGPVGTAAIPGALPDGWAVARVAAAGLGRRDSLVVHRIARTGADLGVIGAAAGMERFAAGNTTGPHPLSPRPVFAVGGGRVFMGESLSPRLRVVDAAGLALPEVVWPAPAPPPVDAVLRRVIDAAAATPGPFSSRERLEAAPVPERLSAFWGVLVDPAGYLWVRPYDPLVHAAALGGLSGPGPGGRWTILALDGAPAGEIELPADFEPASVADEAIVGIARDELGVESVRVYALERR